MEQGSCFLGKSCVIWNQLKKKCEAPRPLAPVQGPWVERKHLLISYSNYTISWKLKEKPISPGPKPNLAARWCSQMPIGASSQRDQLNYFNAQNLCKPEQSEQNSGVWRPPCPPRSLPTSPYFSGNWRDLRSICAFVPPLPEDSTSTSRVGCPCHGSRRWV